MYKLWDGIEMERVQYSKSAVRYIKYVQIEKENKLMVSTNLQRVIETRTIACFQITEFGIKW